MNITPKTIFLLRYHEIAIKGLNRRWFEQALANNAKRIIQTNHHHCSPSAA
jgi:adenylyl- and sulfurtransferase ThiI